MGGMVGSGRWAAARLDLSEEADLSRVTMMVLVTMTITTMMTDVVGVTKERHRHNAGTVAGISVKTPFSPRGERRELNESAAFQRQLSLCLL